MKKLVGMTFLWILLCGMTFAINDNFIGANNVENLSKQIAMLAVFAIGEGIVILSGGIDLSVGSVIAFSGVIVIGGSNKLHLSPWVMAGVMIAACALIGLWHGFLVSKLNLQPFIVTLATMLFLRGLSRGLVDDTNTGFEVEHKWFNEIVDGKFFGIPSSVIVCVVVALLATYLLHTTKTGRYLYAIGRNEKAAAYSGVNVPQVKIISYVLCSVLAGIAGVLYCGYARNVQPASSGNAYELYAIAAAVLGGCSMRAGEGTIAGIILGAAVLRTLANATFLMNIPTQWELSVIGVVILAGVLADIIVKSRQARRA